MSLDVYLGDRNPDYDIWDKKRHRHLTQVAGMEEIEHIVKDYYLTNMPPKYIRCYDSNITHNLGRMAGAAGIYEAVWRPEEIGITKASQLIEPLTEGIAKMKANPDHYKQFNASNGWGTYDQFLPWLTDYLNACKNYPDAEVEASR